MDFDFSPRARELASRVRGFVDTEILPLEHHDGSSPDPQRLAAARTAAKRQDLWAPQLPRELGGQGLELPDLSIVFEAAGRSLLGPLCLGCAAPDEGNAHLLHLAASAAQRQRYLAPLAAGEIRSAFAMTEPHPGAGSDPAMMRTQARREGDGWSIDGRKWFCTGARGAAFYIVAAVTDASAPAKEKMTLFLVDAGHPGIKLLRDVPVMGEEAPGGHGELELNGCRVGPEAVLGKPGEGFALMQVRLGPARLTHCMRWLGIAQRSLEIATARAKERQAFGKALAEHQAVQWLLADSALEMHASRLMVYEAAWRLSRGEKARVETSMCKVFVAETVNRVIDRAIQVCGGLGVSTDLPLGLFYQAARAFRLYDGPSEVHRMVIARSLVRDR
jgi:acyl-CoA dehydrogenase